MNFTNIQGALILLCTYLCTGNPSFAIMRIFRVLALRLTSRLGLTNCGSVYSHHKIHLTYLSYISAPRTYLNTRCTHCMPFQFNDICDMEARVNVIKNRYGSMIWNDLDLSHGILLNPSWDLVLAFVMPYITFWKIGQLVLTIMAAVFTVAWLVIPTIVRFKST